MNEILDEFKEFRQILTGQSLHLVQRAPDRNPEEVNLFKEGP